MTIMNSFSTHAATKLPFWYSFISIMWPQMFLLAWSHTPEVVFMQIRCCSAILVPILAWNNVCMSICSLQNNSLGFCWQRHTHTDYKCSAVPHIYSTTGNVNSDLRVTLSALGSTLGGLYNHFVCSVFAPWDSWIRTVFSQEKLA